jgi:hypothetical protein
MQRYRIGLAVDGDKRDIFTIIDAFRVPIGVTIDMMHDAIDVFGNLVVVI